MLAAAADGATSASLESMSCPSVRPKPRCRAYRLPGAHRAAATWFAPSGSIGLHTRLPQTANAPMRYAARIGHLAWRWVPAAACRRRILARAKSRPPLKIEASGTVATIAPMTPMPGMVSGRVCCPRFCGAAREIKAATARCKASARPVYAPSWTDQRVVIPRITGNANRAYPPS